MFFLLFIYTYFLIVSFIICFIFLELPAGRLSEFLVGFTNKGSNDLVLETLDASLRYPMDFNFHIQNFTTVLLEKTIPPGSQATLGYATLHAKHCHTATPAIALPPLLLVLYLS